MTPFFHYIPHPMTLSSIFNIKFKIFRAFRAHFKNCVNFLLKMPKFYSSLTKFTIVLSTKSYTESQLVQLYSAVIAILSLLFLSSLIYLREYRYFVNSRLEGGAFEYESEWVWACLRTKRIVLVSCHVINMENSDYLILFSLYSVNKNKPNKKKWTQRIGFLKIRFIVSCKSIKIFETLNYLSTIIMFFVWYIFWMMILL